MRRSQIYAILGGTITRPPPWDFVRSFVPACASAAQRAGRVPLLSTNLDAWRGEYAQLETAYQRADPEPPDEPVTESRTDRPLDRQEQHPYRVGPTRRLVLVTGDIRHVQGIEARVNPENTDMTMARFSDFSISGIIRYCVRAAGGRGGP